MKISLQKFYKIPEEQLNGIYEIENWDTFHYVNGKYFSTKEEFELGAYMYKNGLQDYL